MKKSFLTKTATVAAFTVAGIAAIDTTNNKNVQAAIIRNDASVYTVHTATRVYNSYENGQATGQVLAANTSWKVIRTAYDNQGNKWYDLGKNQWVEVTRETKPRTSWDEAHTDNRRVSDYNSQIAKTQNYNNVQYAQAPANRTNVNTGYASNNTQASTQTSTYNAPAYHSSYAAPRTTSSTSNYSNQSYTSNATGSEASAKAWIARHESGYKSYSARNGQFIGKYQLSSSYLHGDYSPANQERTADRYVRNRYGSWNAAKRFWQANGWY